MLGIQSTIRRLNKAYVKMRVAKLDGKYKEGMGMFSMRKRYAAMKNRRKPTTANSAENGHTMASSLRGRHRRAPTSQVPRASGSSHTSRPISTASNRNINTTMILHPHQGAEQIVYRTENRPMTIAMGTTMMMYRMIRTMKISLLMKMPKLRARVVR